MIAFDQLVKDFSTAHHRAAVGELKKQQQQHIESRRREALRGTASTEQDGSDLVGLELYPVSFASHSHLALTDRLLDDLAELEIRYRSRRRSRGR